MSQEVRKCLEFVRHEAEAVHACVKFDMHRIAGYSAIVKDFAECFQGVQIGDPGFKAVVNHFVEIVGAGSQDKDWQADT